MPIVNVKTVAKVLKLTERRVQQLVKDGLPQIRRGQYDLFPCIHWYIDYLQALAQGRPSSSSDMQEHRRRLLAARAEIQELEAGRLAGELGHIGDFELALNEIVALIVSLINRLSGRLSNELVHISEPAVIRQRLLEEIIAIRNEAADRIERLGSDWQRGNKGGNDIKSPSGTDGKSVGRRKPNSTNRKRGTGKVAK